MGTATQDRMNLLHLKPAFETQWHSRMIGSCHRRWFSWTSASGTPIGDWKVCIGSNFPVRQKSQMMAFHTSLLAAAAFSIGRANHPIRTSLPPFAARIAQGSFQP
jgi:hypothetical protein